MMRSILRLRGPAMLCAVGLLLFLHGFGQSDGFPSPVVKQTNRRLAELHMDAPSMAPSRTPIHLSLERVEENREKSQDDSGSNDSSKSRDRPVNWSVNGSQNLSQGINTNTDNRARQLGAIALSLVCAFAVLMMIVVAFMWRNSSQHANPGEVKPNDSNEFVDDVVSRKPDVRGVSILRNGESSLDSKVADYNPGRRVRFQLPGSSSTVDQHVIAAAECGDSASIDQLQAPPLGVPARRRLTKISVVSTRPEPEIAHPDPQTPAPTHPIRSHMAPTKLQLQNDSSRWVTRILHPLTNNSCCPEGWYNSNASAPHKSSASSILDQATIASNSFESASPLFPTSFPSSSYDQQNADNDDDEATEVSDTRVDEADGLESGVLGIMDRNNVSKDDGLVVLEEIGHPQRQREPTKKKSRDRWFDGTSDREVARSKWRKRAWVPVRDTPEKVDARSVTSSLDEFDVEAGAEYVNGQRYSQRLAEI